MLQRSSKRAFRLKPSKLCVQSTVHGPLGTEKDIHRASVNAGIKLRGSVWLIWQIRWGNTGATSESALYLSVCVRNVVWRENEKASVLQTVLWAS